VPYIKKLALPDIKKLLTFIPCCCLKESGVGIATQAHNDRNSFLFINFLIIVLRRRPYQESTEQLPQSPNKDCYLFKDSLTALLGMTRNLIFY